MAGEKCDRQEDLRSGRSHLSKQSWAFALLSRLLTSSRRVGSSAGRTALLRRQGGGSLGGRRACRSCSRARSRTPTATTT